MLNTSRVRYAVRSFFGLAVTPIILLSHSFPHNEHPLIIAYKQEVAAGSNADASGLVSHSVFITSISIVPDESFHLQKAQRSRSGYARYSMSANAWEHSVTNWDELTAIPLALPHFSSAPLWSSKRGELLVSTFVRQ